jgi:hypothetical protein
LRKLKRIHASKELSFYSIEGKVLDIPFYESNVPACFSPFLEQPINTNNTKINLRYFIKIIWNQSRANLDGPPSITSTIVSVSL